MECVCVGVVCRLRRIQSSRYEIGLQIQSAEAADLTYTSLVRSLFPVLEPFTDALLQLTQLFPSCE